MDISNFMQTNVQIFYQLPGLYLVITLSVYKWLTITPTCYHLKTTTKLHEKISIPVITAGCF